MTTLIHIYITVMQYNEREKLQRHTPAYLIIIQAVASYEPAPFTPIHVWYKTSYVAVEKTPTDIQGRYGQCTWRGRSEIACTVGHGPAARVCADQPCGHGQGCALWS